MQVRTKKELIETFALFGGIVAIFFEWLAVLLFYINSPSDFNGEKPVSYFATLPQTRFIFAACLSIAAVSFWIFVRWHLHKLIKTPIKVFAFSMLMYLATAIVPFSLDNGISESIHRLITFSFTASFILGIYLIGKNNVYRGLKIFSLTIAIITSFLTVIMFLLNDRSLLFFFEVGTGFICQLWTIGITYYTYKISSSASIVK